MGPKPGDRHLEAKQDEAEARAQVSAQIRMTGGACGSRSCTPPIPFSLFPKNDYNKIV